MSTLSTEARRLIVEAGLAAVNHGLHREAWAIHAALPALIADANDRRVVEAVMLIGLGHTGKAARLVANVPAPYTQCLDPFLTPPIAGPCVSSQCTYPQDP